MKFTEDATLRAKRLVSLDQFRGYTIAGMLLVGFLGCFSAVHEVFMHNNTYNSYADTIMPQFFFAVGFAYRLTFLRSVQHDGIPSAIRHTLRRNLTLLIIGVVYHGVNWNEFAWVNFHSRGLFLFLLHGSGQESFQTLTHIAVTSLWVLPVIGAKPIVRAGFMMACAVLHISVSYTFYFAWNNSHGTTDGGPLGFISWTIPMLVGSLAYDLVKARGPRHSLRPLLQWSAILMLLGYGLSCITTIKLAVASGSGVGAWLATPPFLAPPKGQPLDYWVMSQHDGAISYLFFASGFSLIVYALFLLISDTWTFNFPVFRTLGQNALLTYIISDYTGRPVLSRIPHDGPLWTALAGFVIYFLLTYGVMRILEYKRIYLKL